MSCLIRFTPLILLVLLISCSSYPPKNFAFPYTFPLYGSIEDVTLKLAEQGFIVSETMNPTEWSMSKTVRGSGSVRGLEIHEIDYRRENNDHTAHQTLRSHQPDSESAIREFIRMLGVLHRDFGPPHRESDGADCIVDKLHSDTSLVRAMERCRDDSIDVGWSWWKNEVGGNDIRLILVDTTILIEFSRVNY